MLCGLLMPSSARRWRRASGRCWGRKRACLRPISRGDPRRTQALCRKRCTSAWVPRACCCLCHSGNTSSGLMRRWAKTVRLALAFSRASCHWACNGASSCSDSPKSKLACGDAMLLLLRRMSAALTRAWLMRASSSGRGTSTPSSFWMVSPLRRMTLSTKPSTGLSCP
ncbi:hypothetical protein D9M70_546620 [compost metagenome]